MDPQTSGQPTDQSQAAPLPSLPPLPTQADPLATPAGLPPLPTPSEPPAATENAPGVVVPEGLTIPGVPPSATPVSAVDGAAVPATPAVPPASDAMQQVVEHIQNGKSILDKMISELDGIASVEQYDLENKTMFVIFKPV